MLRCRSLALPKNGNSRAEYEDASSFDCAAGRFAIADGASESAFAGEWASILCQSFVSEWVDPTRLLEWRSAMQKRWLAAVTSDSLPWYMEEKLQEGAFATFFGLSVREPDNDSGQVWQAWAVGDSCLFHVRGDALLLAFPIDRGGDFGTRPHLIGSRQRASAVPSIAAGTLENGDILFLMTDALAEWFLHDYEAGGAPWHELACLEEDDFAVWIDDLRERHGIKNDDVTLLVIEMQTND